MNLYGFAGGDPVNFSDPFGLCPSCIEGQMALLTDKMVKPWQREAFREEMMGSVMGSTGGVGKVAGRVVIGENMAERVIPYAKEIGADWYKARGTNAANWMRNNMEWLRNQVKAGKEIIDIGIDQSRTVRSEFYQAEKEYLKRHSEVVKTP